MERMNADYTRVSTIEQALEGYSLDFQKEQISKYRDLYLNDNQSKFKLYEDDGTSAKNLNRKNIKKLIEDIKQYKIGKVIVYSLDRLTRSVKDLIHLIDLFEYYDVELISIREKVETKTAMGRFFMMIIILIAEWERETISERTRTRMHQAMQSGLYIFGNPPFGFDVVDKKLVPNKYEIEIVTLIFNMYYFDKYSAYGISAYLSTLTGKQFTWNRVRKILSNKIYIGDYENKNLYIENYIEPQISSDLFDRTQDMLASRSDHDSFTYLFRNVCFDTNGYRLKLSSTTKISSGITYLYYKDKANQLINQKYIEDQVVDDINDFMNRKYKRLVMNRVRELKKHDHAALTLVEMYRDGTISKRDYGIALRDCKKKISDLEKHLLVKNINMKSWNKMQDTEKADFIARYVEKIIIDVPCKIVKSITFI